jgi:hypothetical protein
VRVDVRPPVLGPERRHLPPVRDLGSIL